jgi:hypothetical protein
MLLLACACARGHPAVGVGLARRDSAGVAIVASTRPAWGPGGAWRVDAAPRVDIASDGAGPRLADVRGAVRLDDGRIVVASAGVPGLLAFDARGRAAGALGGLAGAPPRAAADRVGALGDGGVWAWDGADLRLLSFDRRGRAAGSRPFPGERYRVFPRLEGVFGDGSLLLSSQPENVFTVSPLPRRDTLALLRYSFASPRLDTLRSERGPEVFTSGGATSALRQPAPFARSTFVAAHGMEWWVGDGERPELRVYDTRGRLRRVARWAQPPQPIRPEDRDRVVRDFLRRARGSLGAAEARDLAARLPFPASYPAFAALLLDGQGNAWTQDGDPARPSWWTVFDPGGRMLGTVELPPGLTPLEIGDDYVLGSWIAPGGAEHVRLHRLRK